MVEVKTFSCDKQKEALSVALSKPIFTLSKGRRCGKQTATLFATPDKAI